MMNYQNTRGKNKAYAQDLVSQCLVGSLLHPDLTPLRTFRLP